MEFRMQKELTFNFTLDERELISLYSLVQKMNIGYANTIKEFEVTEEELNIIEWLDKYITHSEAYEELKLGEK